MLAVHVSCFDTLNPRNFRFSTLSSASPNMWKGGGLPHCSPEVNDHLLCLRGVKEQVFVLTPLSQMFHLKPIGCLLKKERRERDSRAAASTSAAILTSRFSFGVALSPMQSYTGKLTGEQGKRESGIKRLWISSSFD